jgi:hypothetical protein
MTTLPYSASAGLATTGYPEPQAVDIYVLATRVVHRAETLLPAAEQFPEALTLIEAGFAAALALTADSSWAEVRAARQYLDDAQVELDGLGYLLP